MSVRFGAERDLIEAGLSEAAGWRALWGLLLCRPARDAGQDQLRGDPSGLSGMAPALPSAMRGTRDRSVGRRGHG